MWSKVGPHGQRSTPELMCWAVVAPCIKAVGDVGILRGARSVNPNIFTIYRAGIDQDDQDHWTPDDWAWRILHELGGFRPNAVEYKNEWKQYLDDGLLQRITEERRFVAIMHANGIPVLGGSLSVGSSEKDDILAYQQAGWAGMDYLGVHAYWQKYKPQDVWTAEWYRLVHEWTGGDHPSMILSEWGIDDIDKLGAGWQAQGINAEDYIAQLDTNQARLPDYVKFAAAFSGGVYDKWAKFDLDGIVDLIIAKATEGGVYVPPVQQGGGTVPEQFEYILGFAEYARQHPEIGKPISPLMYDANGTGVQYTETGMLHWVKASNKVLFFRASQ